MYPVIPIILALALGAAICAVIHVFAGGEDSLWAEWRRERL